MIMNFEKENKVNIKCLFKHDWEYIETKVIWKIKCEILKYDNIKINKYRNSYYLCNRNYTEFDFDNYDYLHKKICLRCGKKIDEISLYQKQFKNYCLRLEELEELKRNRKEKAKLLWEKK